MEQPSKQERYFTGMPPPRDPREPLPGEIPPGMKANFIRIGISIGLLGMGVIIGLSFGADTPV